MKIKVSKREWDEMGKKMPIKTAKKEIDRKQAVEIYNKSANNPSIALVTSHQWPGYEPVEIAKIPDNQLDGFMALALNKNESDKIKSFIETKSKPLSPSEYKP